MKENAIIAQFNRRTRRKTPPKKPPTDTPWVWLEYEQVWLPCSPNFTREEWVLRAERLWEDEQTYKSAKHLVRKVFKDLGL